ncbi:RsmF rRNA methyltransferase first C-terminal domain-containing protein [Paenibacillus doosanensis]|uniref:RsmF rRNA methyltransferase first C-terminal domain-containing protein n=1 Tax=Paenibacillus doosanensis TaxID=1229154 RepID=UPI00218074C3|nr:RsmF rRNA methyltransferase first C-terminal domain-containing protein [Paenibacillus doosanensis]MCS7460118.1 RsmF rRNA methyltransferase first C-terminal domain-containing protein [Paenibacillus doosanensis]
MIQLPDAYIRQMKEQLGGEAEAFLDSYGERRTQGLRIRPDKITPDSLSELTKRFGLTPVPWCETGYYYDEASKPGKHPYHAAGLYYIQEPSAMSAAALLAPRPGDVVLDLAAAPGGKSTQIAGMLQGQGLLISNEIHPARAKILSENIERMGITNAVVTQMAPDPLAERFPQFFDKIMVDAPCSGEGMFRKDPDAVSEWSPEHVRMCASRQWDILQAAVTMLKPGGLLAYSTCTFNKAENEDNVAELLRRYPAFELLRTERIWPHRSAGEGHFVALLRKGGDAALGAASLAAAKATPARGAKTAGKRASHRPEEEAMRLFAAFAAEALPGFELPPGEAVLFGGQLYWLPHAAGCPFNPGYLNGLKVHRPGLHLAEVKKGRIEPSHALALALPRGAARQTLDFAADSPEVDRFLRGETIDADPTASGWALVAADGFALGWAKQSGGQAKNHLPKGLRRLGSSA